MEIYRLLASAFVLHTTSRIPDLVKRAVEARLRCRTIHNCASAKTSQIIHNEIEEHEHVPRHRLHLVNDDHTVAQRRNAANGGGLTGKQRIQKLHKRGNDNWSISVLYPHFADIRRRQIQNALIPYDVRMMLKYGAVVVYKRPPNFGVLFQNT